MSKAKARREAIEKLRRLKPPERCHSGEQKGWMKRLKKWQVRYIHLFHMPDVPLPALSSDVLCDIIPHEYWRDLERYCDAWAIERGNRRFAIWGFLFTVIGIALFAAACAALNLVRPHFPPVEGLMLLPTPTALQFGVALLLSAGFWIFALRWQSQGPALALAPSWNSGAVIRTFSYNGTYPHRP